MSERTEQHTPKPAHDAEREGQKGIAKEALR
jgi:type III secretory pathway component EscU